MFLLFVIDVCQVLYGVSYEQYVRRACIICQPEKIYENKQCNMGSFDLTECHCNCEVAAVTDKRHILLQFVLN